MPHIEMTTEQENASIALEQAKDNVAHTVTSMRGTLEAARALFPESSAERDELDDLLGQLDKWSTASNVFLGTIAKK